MCLYKMLFLPSLYLDNEYDPDIVTLVYYNHPRLIKDKL